MPDAFVAGEWGGVRGGRHRKSRMGGGVEVGGGGRGRGVGCKGVVS